MDHTIEKREGTYYRSDQKGFTVMEVLIATLIGLFLSAVMYNVVTVNNKAVTLQMRKAEIQQNLRAGIFIIEAEIKRIGFNPMNLQAVHAPGIIYADKARISYQADLNENGKSFGVDDNYNPLTVYSEGHIAPSTDPGEVATIDLGSNDSDLDGVADSSTASLMRDRVNENGNLDPLVVANNIEVLNFVYLNQDGGIVNGDASAMVYPVSDSLLSEIKKVQVTIVARSSTERPDYVNRHNYVNAQGQEILAAKNDGFDRGVLTKTIDCRNLGLL